jgi:dihydropteroate synthase
MDYHEAADFLYGLRRFSVRPGVESTRALLAHLGDPQASYDCVQVAGSNGKGSTARMVDAVCQAAGLRTGLYTSPHLEDLRERVQVDGRRATAEAVVEFVDRTRPYLLDRAAAGDPLTFFETITAFGLWYFERAGVDVAVLEVGLGGEYDATSAVGPVAAAVTNVELEHEAVLGDTVAEIARTKAEVAPTDRPLVTAAAGEALSVVREVAGEVVTVGDAVAADDGGTNADGPDTRSDRDDATTGPDADVVRDRSRQGSGTSEPASTADPSADDPDVTVAYLGRQAGDEAGVRVAGDGWDVETRIPLLGTYQARNAGVACVLARQVAEVGERDLTERHLRRGLRRANWPGRFEVVERDPTVVLDGAHNPGACRAVARTLEEFAYGDLHVVFGAMHDKDHAGMAAALPPAASVLTARPAVDRAEDPEVLARVVADESDADSVEAVGSVPAAFERARERVDPADLLLVVGSLYLVAEARRPYVRTYRPERIGSRTDARAALDRANVPATEARAAADRTVHRAVETRLDRRQARRLRTVVERAGGTCAVSGLESGGELVETLVAGTLEQFRAVAAALADADDGLNRVGEELLAAARAGDGRLAERTSGSRVGSEPASGPGEVGDHRRPDRVRGRASSGGPRVEASEAEGASGSDDTAGYSWERHPGVMGILNVTPDSFHDGGEYERRADAVERARAIVAAGADVVDVGGESTRPGADPVPVAEEIDRVVPVVEAIADLDAHVSVDTRKPAVAEAALDAGADIINDVTGLEDPEMRFLAADRDVPVIVMHSIDAPVVADKDVPYDDVVRDVLRELRERVFLAERAGIPRHRVVVDPGLGFGKTAAESFELLGRVGEFRSLGCPVLVGHSHKSMFARVGSEAGERLPPTIAASALAVDRGADLVRVHDVPENVAAVRTAIATARPAVDPRAD